MNPLDRFNAWWDRHENRINAIGGVLVLLAIMWVR